MLTQNQSVRTHQEGLYTFDGFPLRRGEHLGPITIAYDTWGRLNETKDNVILIPPTLTADTLVHDEEDPEGNGVAWWNNIVGPGRPIDTSRYFVICPNALGGCFGSTGPSSLNPHTQKPYGMSFPLVTVHDIVKTQRMLIEHLGIQRLEMVIGGSFGGQQALEWAVAYPELVKKVVVVEAAEKMTALSMAWCEIGRQVVKLDPLWKNGDYSSEEKPSGGLAIARMLALTTYLSEQMLEERFGREITTWNVIPTPSQTSDMGERYEVENYLFYLGGTFSYNFDPNSYLYLSRAMNLYDVSDGYPSLETALSRIKSKMLFIGSRSDLLFPAACVRQLAKKVRQCGADTSYWELDTSLGHDAFLREKEQMQNALWSFM
ncbi:MAG TPA: homoserine O-acetyltransferase [Ktedonobacteraceae bacterium]|jgi:homoserine O-acetyltransferase|nr:homoserine O-acetyltransferase [Ktedonobacteraceae bacterium]